ncbi:MAG: sigma-70 family RNA polymerase sigma factor [Proteobacteria bacterium]|nr:sigma-70 family RNA polymerase sigma factor [Pseudomonadota bacterium]
MPESTPAIADVPAFVGDDAAWPGVYAELKALAHVRIRNANSTRLIDTTALVHESWLKLSAVKTLKIDERRQFFAYAAKAMRSVILDIAKSRGRQKRGSGATDATLDSSAVGEELPAIEPVRLDEALRELEQRLPRLGRVVELRYFGGLTESEIAEVLGVTERTVRRDWEKARLLLREILLD